ncbi:MAG TPA: PIG-L family deacetylase [Phycisphaerales bacterium]|nr:PIG-L family deacetylase [Phycisphaerales bacterium]
MTDLGDLKEPEFVRLVHGERRVGPALASVSRRWQGDRECFLMVSPHDDDVVLGAGLLIQLMQEQGVPVHILVVTDGSMGYCDPAERDNITEVRRAETYRSYGILGVPRERIVFLGFPSGEISSFLGRFPAPSYSTLNIAGYTGLQNAFTYWLRRIRPTQCFLPTNNDWHPAHRTVYDEFMISLFHASGQIWPELGKPLEKISYLCEMAVYCDFAAPPTLRIRTPRAYLDRKLEAIRAFASQKQIGMLVENIRRAGPVEILRAVEYRFYDPGRYYDLFERPR